MRTTDTEGELLRERAAIVLAIRDCWYEEELHALQRRYSEIDRKITSRRESQHAEATV